MLKVPWIIWHCEKVMYFFVNRKDLVIFVRILRGYALLRYCRNSFSVGAEAQALEGIEENRKRF